MRSTRTEISGDDLAAGNGLIHRRQLLSQGAILGGSATVAALAPLAGKPAVADTLPVPQWSKEPGLPFVGYGQPSKYEASLKRVTFNPPNEPGSGAAFAPIQHLEGMITPNGLHFERSHSGIPDIDPDAHRLVIHGLVKRPLVFTLEALVRYPMESRITFLECGGNGGALYRPAPVEGTAQTLQGLILARNGPV